jgi:hypothetical protein
MSWFSRRLGRQTPHAAVLRPQVEALEQRLVPTVSYYGGHLLPHVEAQALYYGSAWSSDTTTRANLDTFLGKITNSAYMDVLTRAGYGVGRGTATTGVTDTASLSGTITDGSVQKEIQADITSGKLAAPDANRLYVVYVQKDVAISLPGAGTTTQGILGWHGAFHGKDKSGNAATIRYAIIAYPGGSVGNSAFANTSSFDQQTDVTSHELAEAVTDPDISFGRFYLGWYDSRYGEIADVTENSASNRVLWNGYLVQLVAGQNDAALSILDTSNTSTFTPTNSSLGYSFLTTKYRGHPLVTFTVTITPTSGSVQPGDTVQLEYDGYIIGSSAVKVVNGVATATFTVQFSAAGSYTFEALYSGSDSFLGGFTNSVTVTEP